MRVPRLHDHMVTFVRRLPEPPPELLEKYHSDTLDDIDDFEVLYFLISNYRHERGLYLTPEGYDLLRQHFAHYALSPDKPTTRQIMFMDRNARYPYAYASDAGFVTFDRKLAAAARVFGSLDEFLDSF
jgi:hypothetical protein